MPLLFPDDVQMKMGLIELSAGLGYVVGPAFGSFLYHFGGYISPFAFFSVFQIILAPIIYYIVQKELIELYKKSPQEPNNLLAK